MRWARSLGFLLVAIGEVSWLLSLGTWRLLFVAWLVAAALGALAASIEVRAGAVLAIALGHLAGAVQFLAGGDLLDVAIATVVLVGLASCAAAVQRRRWAVAAVALLVASTASCAWVAEFAAGLLPQALPVLVGSVLFGMGSALASLGLLGMAPPAPVCHPRMAGPTARA